MSEKNVTILCRMVCIIQYIVAYWPHMTSLVFVNIALLMICCRTAPSYYLNQCWYIITKVLLGLYKKKLEDSSQ